MQQRPESAPLFTWQYDEAERLWRLYAGEREIYSVASNRQPSGLETFRIIRRLRRFYPWLRPGAGALERSAA